VTAEAQRLLAILAGHGPTVQADITRTLIDAAVLSARPDDHRARDFARLWSERSGFVRAFVDNLDALAAELVGDGGER
jgi:hypothetical protein